MRLSYLDILLSTLTIFVVLFGILARKGELPEKQGKALVMVATIPLRDSLEGYAIEIKYSQQSIVLQHLPLVSLNEIPVQGLTQRWKQLQLVITKNQNAIEVEVTGQPERKSAVAINLVARLSEKNKKELEELQNAPMPGMEKLWRDWIAAGESFVFSSGQLPGARSEHIDNWRKRCPSARGADRMYDDLRSILANFSNTDGVRLNIEADTLAYALIVHDVIVPKEKALPKQLPDGAVSGRIKDAFFRIKRHLKLAWGQADVDREVWWSRLKADRLPMWCGEPSTDRKEFPELPLSKSQANLETRIANPDGGLFLYQDHTLRLLPPGRIQLVYAGAASSNSEIWAPSASDPSSPVWLLSFVKEFE